MTDINELLDELFRWMHYMQTSVDVDDQKRVVAARDAVFSEIKRMQDELTAAVDRNEALMRMKVLPKTAALQDRIAELERHVEQLQEKCNAICACSYDYPDDVCLEHSPKLKAAETRIAELEAINAGLHKAQDYVYIGRDGKAVQARELEEQIEYLEATVKEYDKYIADRGLVDDKMRYTYGEPLPLDLPQGKQGAEE